MPSLACCKKLTISGQVLDYFKRYKIVTHYQVYKEKFMNGFDKLFHISHNSQM